MHIIRVRPGIPRIYYYSLYRAIRAGSPSGSGITGRSVRDPKIRNIPAPDPARAVTQRAVTHRGTTFFLVT